MSKLSNIVCGCAVAIGLAGASVGANAIVLNPGDTEALLGTTHAANPHLGGYVIHDDIINFNFNASGTITGRVQQRVVRSNVDNTLDFYWRVMNDETSEGAIGSFRVWDFEAPEYDVDWRIDGLGDEAPSRAHRFTGDSDSSVNFLFDGDGLLAGDSSNFFFFDTTATDYAYTAFFDLTGTGLGGISDAYSAYTPTASDVAAPSSLALMGLGFFGVAAARRRLKK